MSLIALYQPKKGNGVGPLLFFPPSEFFVRYAGNVACLVEYRRGNSEGKGMLQRRNDIGRGRKGKEGWIGVS